MKPIDGKVAIVTGTSAPNGIGRAIALRLARDGARLVVTDQAGKHEAGGVSLERRKLLDDLVSEINSLGGDATAYVMDVTSHSGIKGCVQKTIATYGQIDILVNNAGSLEGSDFLLSTTPEQWENSFKINLLGPMMLSQAVIPEMVRRGGGRIVNIGSVRSLGVEAGYSAYTTMKHGLIGLTKSIAAEFGSKNILCNTVCPGYIMTDMHAAANERMAKKNNISVAEMEALRYSGVAVQSAGDPQDVASAVAYLAGPEGRYVTGISLPVSGGVPFGI